MKPLFPAGSPLGRAREDEIVAIRNQFTCKRPGCLRLLKIIFSVDLASAHLR